MFDDAWRTHNNIITISLYSSSIFLTFNSDCTAQHNPNARKFIRPAFYRLACNHEASLTYTIFIPATSLSLLPLTVSPSLFTPSLFLLHCIQSFSLPRSFLPLLGPPLLSIASRRFSFRAFFSLSLWCALCTRADSPLISFSPAGACIFLASSRALWASCAYEREDRERRNVYIHIYTGRPYNGISERWDDVFCAHGTLIRERERARARHDIRRD